MQVALLARLAEDRWGTFRRRDEQSNCGIRRDCRIALSVRRGCNNAPIANSSTSHSQDSRYSQLANTPFPNGYPSQSSIQLKDELVFQRAVQSYLWALPVLNMYGMKDGSEKAFGAGYNVLPIFKDRLNAKTLVTTPNSDVIYAMGYVDLKDDGPLVIEVPPGLQGILDDFFQRPICSEQPIEGRTWCGDVGLPGPTMAKARNICCCLLTIKARYRKAT